MDNFTHHPLYPQGKLPELHGWSGCFGEEKSLLSLPGIKPQVPWPVA